MDGSLYDKYYASIHAEYIAITITIAIKRILRRYIIFYNS